MKLKVTHKSMLHHIISLLLNSSRRALILSVWMHSNHLPIIPISLKYKQTSTQFRTTPYLQNKISTKSITALVTFNKSSNTIITQGFRLFNKVHTIKEKETTAKKVKASQAHKTKLASRRSTTLMKETAMFLPIQ